MKIVVAIPVHNALDALKKTIKTLYKNTNNKFSLLICDDYSDKPTSDYIDTLPAKRIIRNKRQLWFTRSANSLIILGYLSGADYIFLLNSDLILGQGWDTQLLNHFELNDKIPLVGSLHKGGGINRSVKPPQYVTGHCWCLKTSLLPKIGILNEKHVHIESDREYCHRIHYKGYSSFLDVQAPVGHVGGASWGYNMAKVNKVNKDLLPLVRPINIFDYPEYLDSVKEKYKI